MQDTQNQRLSDARDKKQPTRSEEVDACFLFNLSNTIING